MRMKRNLDGNDGIFIVFRRVAIDCSLSEIIKTIHDKASLVSTSAGGDAD